jgi:hypothetical protein
MSSGVIPVNKFSLSVRLWYYTNLLHGVWWAVSLAIIDGSFSFSLLVVTLAITSFAAAASALVIPCAIPLFAYVSSLARRSRLIAAGMVISALWGLSTVPLMLIPGYVPYTIYTFLSYTLPGLGAAYVAAAYVYRRWLFQQ